MLQKNTTYRNLLVIFFWVLATCILSAQEPSFSKAANKAEAGDLFSAQKILQNLVQEQPQNMDALVFLGQINSWVNDYESARGNFNVVTSKEPKNRAAWIGAVKNELYAKEYYLALGLANKAIHELPKGDIELERLRELALNSLLKSQEMLENRQASISEEPTLPTSIKQVDPELNSKDLENKKEKNRLGIDNLVTVFNERYDPIFFSSLSYKRDLGFGSMIPKINYINRGTAQGVQYDIDLYPKFRKGMYAYLNYGYATDKIFPAHKMAGDLYVSLPGAIEVSAGGRYMVTQTQNVKAVTNSISHYRGNYYFSLRSYITPRPDRMTRFSANLLVRKYGKDADNYWGASAGIGYSPELKQLVVNDELLAETLLYIESQRMNIEYQFTGKNNKNLYKARLGIRRQELSFDTGNYFWAFSAGFNYHFKF